MHLNVIFFFHLSIYTDPFISSNTKVTGQTSFSLLSLFLSRTHGKERNKCINKIWKGKQRINFFWKFLGMEGNAQTNRNWDERIALLWLQCNVKTHLYFVFKREFVICLIIYSVAFCCLGFISHRVCNEGYFWFVRHKKKN